MKFRPEAKLFERRDEMSWLPDFGAFFRISTS
jgi:hypothetical protein